MRRWKRFKKGALRFARGPASFLAATLGDGRDWAHIVMYRECFREVENLEPERLSVLEISASDVWPARFSFAKYRTTRFPDFDICTDRLDEEFDLIIADQVFEHIPQPDVALQNVRHMLRVGGTFLITTPFLIRFHPVPSDYWRWTEDGLRLLLERAQFARGEIHTDSWGNRACVRAQLKRPDEWPRRGFGSLRNEPDFPVVVWAFARKTGRS